MSSDFGSDPWIDARLRDVPIPPGVLARVEKIAATSDEQLDLAIRQVELPPDLLARLDRIPRLGPRRIPWRELSLAATLLVGATLGLMNMPRRGVERSSGDGSRFVGNGPGRSTVSGKGTGDTPEQRPGSGRSGMFVPGVDTLPLADGRQQGPLGPRRPAEKPASLMQSHLAAGDRSTATETAEQPGIEDASATGSPRRDGILAAPSGSDRLPRLEMVNYSLSRGLAPPIAAGYDFLFQLKTGERPFVSPEVDPLLASSPVPLVRDQSSYLAAREAIGAGHLPAAEEVRIEDFLAAMDGLFPVTNQPLALHTAAGPAPFGEAGMQLLQVGLRTGGPTVVDPATGLPRVLAHGATLTVKFNPKVVQAYRLVGHGTTTLTGPVAAVTQVDLVAGIELAGLFEMWLKPDGGNDVATIDLAWHDANNSGNSAQRHMAARVVRSQFAGSFAEAPASLQAVALAAETARLLRSHAAPGRGLGRVLDLAGQVKPQLRSQPSFAELVQLVTAAEKARPNPGPARRAAAGSEP
jgi:hypothetical protein